MPGYGRHPGVRLYLAISKRLLHTLDMSAEKDRLPSELTWVERSVGGKPVAGLPSESKIQFPVQMDSFRVDKRTNGQGSSFLHSAESRLLIACAGRVASPQKIRQLLRADLEWEWILGRAVDYGTAPAMYCSLKNSAPEQLIGTEIMARLHSLYRRSCVEQINASGKLKEILLAFSRVGIAVIVLKGAALAELVYHGLGLRTMLDLDLLVRKADLDLADDVLRQLGYVPDESYQSREWYREHHHHLAPYVAGDRSLVLEVHHHVVPTVAPVSLAIDDFWQRARPAQIASVPALVLSPQDLLLSICIHLCARQYFVRTLRDLSDIAATIAVYGAELDWDRLVREATTYEASRCLYYSLWLAHCIVEAPLPPRLLNSLKAAAGIGRTRDHCLKFLALRAVFPGLTIIPAGFIGDAIRELLYPKFAGGTVAMLSKWIGQRSKT